MNGVDEALQEARAAVAAGAEPDWRSLRRRIREAAPEGPARRDGLARLERIHAVHRARSLARVVEPRPAPPGPRRAPLRTRPTVTGNMDVRRERDGAAYVLAWEPERSVERWELRISERRDARGDYEAVDTTELPADVTAVSLPLGEHPVRVHVLGRTRGGRLVRRAIVSGLAPETWDERLQRRPSAA
jgi:hypothetical protein